jgi:RNA polymerase sigma factor (sigma-70 family)
LAPSERELEALIARYAHRVPYFTGQVQRRFMLGDRWHDELLSAGYWGLFKAIRNRRDDAHERELSAYVSRRVEGAVIDEARSCLARAVRTDGPSSTAAGGPLDALEVGDEPGARARLGTLEAHESDVDDPERVVASRRRRSAIEDMLAVLEPEGREVLRAYMEGDSISEIARARGVSAGTMQARFKKLTQRVRAGAPALRGLLLEAQHD